MNDKEFMGQKANEMTMDELLKAIKIKAKEALKIASAKSKDRKMTFNEEIQQSPERFESLTTDGWKTVTNGNGVSDGNTKVLNETWNNYGMNYKVFYVEFENYDCKYKEIIRRK